MAAPAPCLSGAEISDDMWSKAFGADMFALVALFARSGKRAALVVEVEADALTFWCGHRG